ncbi:MAG: hypothetical protein M1816_000902 [Peltula sp. TS41687]|nr:MAG: hypothetical protein M1816_000902 [Peltula sp. TS41687]
MPPFAGLPRPPPYTKSVDVWSLGLSMVVLDRGWHIKWQEYGARRLPRDYAEQYRYVSRDVYPGFKQYMKRLRESYKTENGVEYLTFLARMTEWDGMARMSMEELSPALDVLIKAREKGSIRTRRGQKRALEGSEKSIERAANTKWLAKFNEVSKEMFKEDMLREERLKQEALKEVLEENETSTEKATT